MEENDKVTGIPSEVSPALTENEIDEIDLRTENEEDLFSDSKEKIIETEDDVKIPLSYENAEEALLAMFMQDDDVAQLVVQSNLKDIHFRKRKNKLMFPHFVTVRFDKGICNYALVADQLNKESMPDGQSVLDFAGGLPELTNIIACTPAVVDLRVAQGYIDIIFEQYRLAKIQEEARWILNQKKFEESKIVDKLAKIQQVVVDATLKEHGLVPLDVLATDSYERYKDRRLHPEKYQGIKTGFYWMDKRGIIARKRLSVLGAKTTVGKSILVSNIITNILLNDFKVLLFTPELDSAEYIDRLICGLAGVEIDAYKDATIDNTEVDRIGVAKSKLISKASNLYIEDRGSQSCSYIITSIKKHMLNHKVDVVCIDYLQTLYYFGDNTKKEITTMMERFRSFAKDNNIAFIVVSQLRRTDKAEPVIYDLKESGDIENIADSVVLLHRNSTTKLGERTKGWYRIDKNRQGGTTDNVELTFNEATLKFVETDRPEEGVDNQGTLVGGYDDDIPDEDRPTEQSVVDKVMKEQGTL